MFKTKPMYAPKEHKIYRFRSIQNLPADSAIYPLTLEDTRAFTFKKADAAAARLNAAAREKNLRSDPNYYTIAPTGGVYDNLVFLSPFQLKTSRRHLERITKEKIRKFYEVRFLRERLLNEVFCDENGRYNCEQIPTVPWPKNYPRGLSLLANNMTGACSFFLYSENFNYEKGPWPERKFMPVLRQIFQPSLNLKEDLKYMLRKIQKILIIMSDYLFV